MSTDAGYTGDARAQITITWSPIYHWEWDATPGAYVDAGVVVPGRSRRLAKVTNGHSEFKAYLGVQHFDPSRWNLPGESTTKFFASFFVQGRTVALRTYPTMTEALSAVHAYAAALDSREGA